MAPTRVFRRPVSWAFGVTLVASLWPAPSAALEYTRPGQVQDLSGAWLFHAGDNPTFSRPTLDDYQWQERRLPVEGVPWAARWEGRAWLRLHVAVDEAAIDEDLVLALGTAREAVEVYVNGSLVATRGSFQGSGRSGPRNEILTAFVPAGLLGVGDNVVALRIYDPTYASGVPQGPLLLGPPEAVQPIVEPKDSKVLSVRFGVGALAIFVGIGQLLLLMRRRASRDVLWLLVAGVCFGFVLLSGTGLYDGALPSAALSARVPIVLTPLGVLALGSYFAHRLGDANARRVLVGRIALFTFASLALLLPAVALALVGEPLLLLGSLAVTLYAAHLAAQAARRRDRTAPWVFVSTAVAALLIVYDGLVVATGGAMPAWALVGAVGVILTTTLVSVWETAREQEDVLRRMLDFKRRLEERTVNLLDAVSVASEDVDAYLVNLINEITSALSVRRCSLMLVQPDGSLRIRASVGLPRHANATPIDVKRSIGGWVFTHGRPATSTTIPEGLTLGKKGSAYLSEAFVSQPLFAQSRVIGVLNVSDPHGGRSFDAEAETRAGVLANKLAAALGRLPAASWVPPPQPEKVIKRLEGPEAKAREADRTEIVPTAGVTERYPIERGGLDPTKVTVRPSTAGLPSVPVPAPPVPPSEPSPAAPVVGADPKKPR